MAIARHSAIAVDRAARTSARQDYGGRDDMYTIQSL